MKHNGRVRYRSGPEKFVKIFKWGFFALSAVLLPTLMVLLALAWNTEGVPQIVYSVSAAVAALLFFVLYGFYALHVSMGTVIGLEVTDKVVHLHTKRKVFTYDVFRGCVGVVEKGNRFICTFETQDSRDKFIFYKHAPFTRYSDEQFTAEDIRMFYRGQPLETERL